jgi:hypothetical protein
VTGSADVTSAAVLAFAASQCAEFGSVSHSSAEEFSVPVLPDAAVESFTVAGVTGGVRVTFVDPDGQVINESGRLGGSTFEISDEPSSVRLLRVTNPIPGAWTVRVVASDGTSMGKIRIVAAWSPRAP